MRAMRRAAPLRAPRALGRRSYTTPDRALSAHPIFAAAPAPGIAEIKLVHGSWDGKYVVINKPAGITSQEVPERLRAMGVLTDQSRIHLPHRLDKHTEGLMAIALDKFTGSLLSRELEAGRWVRKYRAIVEKPPCCQQSPTSAAPERCCMKSSMVQGTLTKRGKLDTEVVQCSSFIARSAVNADPRDSVWQQREEQKRKESRLSACPLVTPPRGAENPVPASLRWQSVSDMHPEAKLCVTAVKLLQENSSFALYEVQPGTGRPHQMRVQLAELGFPVANDPYYNPAWLSRQLRTEASQWASEAKMLLQAHYLEFPDPFEAKNVVVALPHPLTLIS